VTDFESGGPGPAGRGRGGRPGTTQAGNFKSGFNLKLKRVNPPGRADSESDSELNIMMTPDDHSLAG